MKNNSTCRLFVSTRPLSRQVIEVVVMDASVTYRRAGQRSRSLSGISQATTTLKVVPAVVDGLTILNAKSMENEFASCDKLQANFDENGATRKVQLYLCDRAWLEGTMVPVL